MQPAEERQAQSHCKHEFEMESTSDLVQECANESQHGGQEGVSMVGLALRQL